MKSAGALAGSIASLAIVLAAMLTPPGAWAELSPTPVSGDSRLVDFEYDQDNIYLVMTRPKRSTFVRFGADEKVTYVAAGDSKDFELAIARSLDFMEVKPKFENIETNVTVVTTKRTYHLMVRSTFDGGKWYARVTWKYPQVALLDLTGQARVQDEAASAATGEPQDSTPGMHKVRAAQAEIDASVIERLNFNYVITGDAAFRPVRVMDDGQFTYVTLPEGIQELPAVFRAEPDDPARMALVSYEVKSGGLVIQRVMDSFMLKLGKDEVKIARNRRHTHGLPTGEAN
jgi:type IV secretion system protein VirB9